jgi:hypothetical protein
VPEPAHSASSILFLTLRRARPIVKYETSWLICEGC